jgi:CspA family cold shock protein
MNFRDTLVTCVECGQQFIFTVEAQREMAERGLPVTIPDLCSDCTQRDRYAGKLHGRIKWFSLEKGYGFIIKDDGSEVFVHRNGLVPTGDGTRPTLGEGEQVLFELSDTPKGPQAIQVTPYHGQDG